MNRLALGVASLTLAASAFVFAPSDALAQQRTGFYGSINAGGLFVNDQDIEDGVTASYDPGYFVSAAIGKRFDNNIRGEIELSYAMVGLDSVESLSVSGGDVSMFGLTVGGFYDFNLGGAFTPYLGAGAGFVHAKMDDLTVDFGGGPVTAPSDSTTELTLFGEAGVAYALTHNIEIVPSYRFQWINADGLDTMHVVKVGLRYGF
jgi:opacity protein-like surface antigen